MSIPGHPFGQWGTAQCYGKSDANKQAAIHQWEIGTCFILGADKSHFGKLQCDLQDNFACGTNQFPTTLTAAYNLLLTTEAAIGAASDMDTLDDSGGHSRHDRIPSTTPGAEPPRDARDSGSARSHSTHLETSSSD